MFFNSFWSGLGLFQPNKVKENLEKDPNIDLDDLLEEDNFLSDIKNLPKFTDYLIKNPDRLKKLIDYCI